MSQIIKLKTSATPDSVPSTGDLILGEVAVNTNDGKMYLKKDDGSESIVEVGGGATVSEKQITNLSIYPSDPTASASTSAPNNLAPSNTTALRNAVADALYITSEPVSGTISALNFGLGTATIGGVNVTLQQREDISNHNLSDYSDLVFESAAELRAVGMTKVDSTAIDKGDVCVSVQGYNGTWEDGETEVTRTEYTLTTLQRVRDALGDPTWFPDGVRDFGLYGLNVYIAKASGSQYSLRTLGVKSGTDITTELTAALTNAEFRDNGLDIPAGTFYLSADILCEFPNVVIKGAGTGLTRLIFTNDSGFLFGTNTPTKSIEMTDLSIHTRAQSTKAAVYVNHEIGSRPMSLFHRTFIAGVNDSDELSSGRWFFRGIYLMNAMQPTFDNCRFIGATGATVADIDRAESAIRCDATDGAVIPRITNCWSLNFSRGVMMRSVATPSIEGIYIAHCDWVFVNYGVDIEFLSGAYLPPQINIGNMHTEAFLQNISISGAKEIIIHGCLLYAFNSAEPQRLVYIDNCEDIRIHDNMFIGRPNNTVTEGIRCNDCDTVDVYNNTIDTVNTHIAATGTTTEMKERGNTIKGTGGRTADTTGNTTNKMGWTRSAAGGNYSYSYYTSEGLLVMGGSVAITFASDFGTLFYPREFNQIYQLVLTNGDGNASLLQPVVWTRRNTDATIAVSGLGSQPYRLDWQATGV